MTQTDALLKKAVDGQEEAQAHQKRYDAAIELLKEVYECISKPACSTCDSSCSCMTHFNQLTNKLKEFFHATT